MIIYAYIITSQMNMEKNMQKNYDGLRVTFGKKTITFAIPAPLSYPDNYRIAVVPLTNLHQLTLLAYLIHPAGFNIRSKFGSNFCHVILNIQDLELKLGLARELDDDGNDYGWEAIYPILIFGYPAGDSNDTLLQLDTNGAGGLLATDILNHLGEEHCRCQVCEDLLKND